jgi:hypothetical protein
MKSGSFASFRVSGALGPEDPEHHDATTARRNGGGRACISCAAWNIDAPGGFAKSFGQCRKRSPRPGAFEGSSDGWPKTSETDWCMEHEGIGVRDREELEARNRRSTEKS